MEWTEDIVRTLCERVGTEGAIFGTTISKIFLEGSPF